MFRCYAYVIRENFKPNHYPRLTSGPYATYPGAVALFDLLMASGLFSGSGIEQEMGGSWYVCDEAPEEIESD